MLKQIDAIMDNYNACLLEKDACCKFIKNEMMEREIMKQEKFSKVKVQINFLKFTGYE